RDIILGHIDIGRDAACGIGAEVSTNVQESVGGGNLTLLINDAARGAAPELHACRPFKHLHLVVVEAVAVVAAEITNAVEEYIVTRSKSADGQIVALRSALSRSNTYSWDVTNDVGERTILFIMQNKVRDYSHRLRCVQKVLGEFSHRDSRRQLCRHIDRVGVLHADRSVVRILEAAIQARAIQQLAES